jgi:hypothetical protein
MERWFRIVLCGHALSHCEYFVRRRLDPAGAQHRAGRETEKPL